MSDAPLILQAGQWRDYRLIDSGEGRKLERVGRYLFDRPEPQAFWPRSLSPDHWAKADAAFDAEGGDADEKGRWLFHKSVAERWPLDYRGLRFEAFCAPFRHLGFFPEQAPHWDWVEARLRAAGGGEILNLFGYTGLATLTAAKAGARVTHVDASKKAIGYAKANQEIANLASAPIRWMCDDAYGFCEREVRRNRTYDCIILDPPKHGRGPNGEIWKIEDGLTPLLAACRTLLDRPDGRAKSLVATLYAVRLSFLALHRAIEAAFEGAGGFVESGEMALVEESGKLLPTAIFARWRRERSDLAPP